MKTIRNILIAVFGIVFLAVILTLPTYWLWNWLMPQLFALPRITLWQAVGLTTLTRCLFGTGR